jgi:CO/xanthine dehydrogenase FAD-binding subunit
LTQPNRTPLGGGTLLSRAATDAVEAVDLQSLNLDTIEKQGNNLKIGATVTLQQLLESEHCPQSLKSGIRLEAPLNLRNAATVAGTLVACDGRSTFASVLLAMDARLEQVKLADSKTETQITICEARRDG